ncbi:MAG: nitric oxide reductase transcriptional regulator NorR [Desulfobacteraceae bacterium]|nr:MAG: nitric oxide reductase transcriptional regulator NorR [Desulfobacteraceae bacterium]
MKTIDLLIDIALDMTAGLTAEARYQRLLDALKRVIPYDAAALLRLEGEEMRVAAAIGLAPDAMGRRFRRESHPRLDIICNAAAPVRFPADAPYPDPFDGLLEDMPPSGGRIHSCLGCPLRAGETLIGALTADAIDPHAFDGLDLRFIQAVAALAAAQMQTIDLIQALAHSAEKMGLIAKDLMQDARKTSGLEPIGRSTAMQRLRREIELVAPSDFSVLVTGETGVGKELVVRAIHAGSRRREQPMLYLNCAALPEALAESELFGHVRGAFTSAVADRTGKFELADGGTLFLDEIGELPLTVQPKLLRVLQHGEIQRVGDGRAKSVDVRLLAATNRDLEKEISAGRFRADLFHRLNVYPLRVPPLRERREDIPLLAGYFCDKIQRQLGLGPVRLSSDTLQCLNLLHWPGNVRELENVISRAVLKASAQTAGNGQVEVGPAHMGLDSIACVPDGPLTAAASVAPLPGRQATLREAVDSLERDLIVQAVTRHHGNWAAAARQLGMNRSNLFKLAVRLGIQRKGRV